MKVLLQELCFVVGLIGIFVLVCCICDVACVGGGILNGFFRVAAITSLVSALLVFLRKASS